MRADTLTPRDIFGRDVRYLIPMFQRPYVWNKEQHWEPLWEDVMVVAERLLEERDLADQAATAEQQTPPHFLGAVVLDQQLGPVAEFDARHVIDGQQRLTTLQLLLDAAQEVVEEYGDLMDARMLSRLVLNDEDLIRSAEDRFKVWPTNVDREAFAAVMTNGASVPSHLERTPIVRAHRYFRSAIEEWAGANEDPDKRTARLNALTTTLRGLLRLVVIDLEPHDNAQVIFETLNARGTPLLASDLIKNLLLQTVTEGGGDVEELYERYWRDFDSERWRREVRQGRLKRPRVDAFLNYWLLMETTREVPSHQLYPLFRSHVKTHDAVELMKKASRYSQVYDQFDSFPWTSPEGTFMYRWRVMEQSVFTPLLLRLFGETEGALPIEERRRALAVLESWLVRRMLCRLTTKDYNRLQLDLLERLDARTGESPAEIVIDFFGGQGSDSRLWPSDDQVTDAVLEEEFYRRLTRARLRMVLEAVEDHLRSPKAEEQHVVRGRLTIEHLMPQTWEINWPAEAHEPSELARARRSRLIHTLGNLTLVNNKLNPALSNSPWDSKRHEIQKHSVLQLNRHLLEAYWEEWTEDTIRQRSSWLASQIIQIWPSPERF